VSCARARVVAVKVHAELFAAAFSKRAIMEAGDGGKDLDFGWCVFYYCRTYYIAVRVGVD
jgi:hypothetical protein